DETPELWRGGAATPAEAVAEYRRAAGRHSELERQSEARPKTGVFTGAYATSPANGQAMPAFIADYALRGYCTGAIMAVPAEDERDWDFAQVFGLAVIRTVQPPNDWTGGAYTGEGAKVNSSNAEIDLDGMPIDLAKT